ncbi:MAG: DUF3631 domain-containing protein [Rhodomicrobium sp.]
MSKDLQHKADGLKADFEAAMRAAGLIPPRGGIVADGEIHRCDVEGKGGKSDGVYCLHLDGVPAGWFQNHRDGAGVQRWHARTGQKLTPAEIAAFKEKLRKQQAARDADLAKRQAETAKRAQAILDGSEEAPADHPYFVKKKIKPVKGVKYSKEPVAISLWRNSAPGVLLVPMYDIEGTLRNVQAIDGDGNKYFLKDGRKTGCFYVIGKKGMIFTRSGLNPAGLSLIAEGFATATSCFEAMDVLTVVAFDCGNLEPVAKALRAAYPKVRFIICGDDDWKTKDATGKLTNPGNTHAMCAAKAIGAEVAFPVFPADHHRVDRETDFNDLAAVAGLGEVRRQIETAEPAEKREEREVKGAHDLVDRIEARILQLAALSETAYETVKKDVATALGIGVGYLNRRVKEARKAVAAGAAPDPAEKDKAKKPAVIATLEPWPEAVDGGELLRELAAAFKRHVVMSDEEALAAALWVLHSHMLDAASISPILMVKSPQKKCGKTTLMKMLKWLAAEALMASNLTASSVFRVIDQWQPTLIIDEGDSFLKNSEELRGVLNSGHDREGACVLRTVETGKGHTIKEFSTWAAKAIALIGAAPDTLEDRSIPIKLRRKLRSEKIVRLRSCVQEIKNIGRKCARWSADNLEELRGRDAAVPRELVNDRAADNWRVLLDIAEQIGGEWPARARVAALAVEGVESEPDADGGEGIRLLADCRTVFEKRDATVLSAADIIVELCNLEENPWADYRFGKRITETAFGQLLKPFDIKSRRDTHGRDRGKKKWHKVGFADAWLRYLPENSEKDGPIPFQAFTGFTDLKNKGNPASQAFTAVKPCDDGKPKYFNAVNGVKAQNPLSREDLNFSGGLDGFSGKPSPQPDGGDDAEEWEL